MTDGTKIILPRMDETVEAYEPGSGRPGNAYFPQIHAGGFLDLATGTFADVNFEHGAPVERQIVLEDARRAEEPTLYVCDAGHNGMAHIYLLAQTGHHVLMELKMGRPTEAFSGSRQRSKRVLITLSDAHLRNYPQYAHLKGTVFTVRLIRTYSSGKLRSRILLTTLLDERRYKWRDLVRLYLQRWRIELPGKWKTTGRRQQMFGHSAAVGGQSSQKRRIGPRPPIPEVLYVCDPERPPRK